MGCKHPNTMGCNNSHLHIPSQNANIRPAYNKELVSELELELGLELKVLLELQLAVPMELVMELVLQLVVLMEFEVLEMERCEIKNTISRDGVFYCYCICFILTPTGYIAIKRSS